MEEKKQIESDINSMLAKLIDILKPRLGDFSINPSRIYETEYMAMIRNNKNTMLLIDTSTRLFHLRLNLDEIKSSET